MTSVEETRYVQFLVLWLLTRRGLCERVSYTRGSRTPKDLVDHILLRNTEIRYQNWSLGHNDFEYRSLVEGEVIASRQSTEISSGGEVEGTLVIFSSSRTFNDKALISTYRNDLAYLVR